MWENLSPVSQELTLNPMQCFYWYFIAPSVKSCQKIFTPARIKGYFLYQTTVTFQTFSLVSSAARLLSQPLWGEIVFYSMYQTSVGCFVTLWLSRVWRFSCLHGWINLSTWWKSFTIQCLLFSQEVWIVQWVFWSLGFLKLFMNNNKYLFLFYFSISQKYFKLF